MRILYLLTMIYIASILSGCMSNVSPSSPAESQLTGSSVKKDPLNVSFLTTSSPQRPYQVLGEAKVSTYNFVGIKRQEATMRDLIRQQAASLGGDAVIDIKHDPKSVSATIIAYKRILV